MTAFVRSVDTSERLSAAKLRAIAALLEGGDQLAAATAARRTPRSVRRWLRDETFQRALATASRDVLTAAVQRLQAGADAAAKALVGMARGELPPSASRVSAARAVLELARDQGEADEIREIVELLAEKINVPTGRYQ